MAKLLSRALTLRRSHPTLSHAWRFRSTISGEGSVVEVEVLSSSSSSEGGEPESVILKKLDDIVHRVIVQKSTPDWLPFLPGSSFWVPPRQGRVKFADLLRKLADQLTEDESLALTSDRGWPSSKFFVNRGGIAQSRKMNVEADKSAEWESEVEDEFVTNSRNYHPFEDEEG